ncbi:unnamed protein product [Pneumocystis jirovecii]|uniref:Uncharacterized protein n=1 Tax=Pneumocystis jirovecii TaxID=42068 RepID=L0PAN8_PNEJI|nr:unnamed protein product [Pneumocystis jirovecii]
MHIKAKCVSMKQKCVFLAETRIRPSTCIYTATETRLQIHISAYSLHTPPQRPAYTMHTPRIQPAYNPYTRFNASLLCAFQGEADTRAITVQRSYQMYMLVRRLQELPKQKP